MGQKRALSCPRPLCAVGRAACYEAECGQCAETPSVCAVVLYTVRLYCIQYVRVTVSGEREVRVC